MQILYIDCHIGYYVILCELCRILYEEFYTEYYVISYELCRILYIERYVEYYVRLQFCDRVSLSWPGKSRIYNFLHKPCEYLELHACTNRYGSGDS